MTDDSSATRGAGRLQSQPLLHDHPTARRVAVLLWALSALLFIALAIPVLAEGVRSVDDAVFDAAVSAEWRPAVVIAKVLDFVGSAWVTVPLMLGVAVWLGWRKRWEAFATWILVMVSSQLLIGPVKDAYERVRPPQSLVETTSWSFPSGHSVAGAAIAISIVIVLVPAGPRRRNLEILAATFAVVMALSRVYLRAHWLSDVAAGAALGAALAIGAASLIHWIDEVVQSRNRTL
jgi:undecaprenyl-diphosphatase